MVQEVGNRSHPVPMWLEPPPGAERLAEALAWLAARSSAMGHTLVDPVSPSSEGAFGLGISLVNEAGGGDAEIGRCWLWVAASLGHPRAAAELVREIMHRGTASAPGMSAQSLMAVLGEWHQRARTAEALRQAAPASPLPPIPPRRQGRGGFRAIQDPMGEDPFEPEPEELPIAPEHGRIVIPRIGDADSREGRDISKRFAHVIGRRLPFRGRMPDPGDLSERFQARFPWAPGLARYLEGQFSLLRASGVAYPKLPPLLLVGPSGCGKTTMLEWLAAECQLPHVTVPVGGTSDSAGLTAVARGWVTAQASVAVNAFADFNAANPAIVLDEVEKGVSDVANRNGSVMGALLAMLQPTSEGYRDVFLMAEVDLSHVTFLASANSLAPLSDPFRKRFLVQPVPAPGPEHFDAILPGVVENEARRLGVRSEFLPWLSRDDKAWLKSVFVGAGGSIRQLEQAHRILIGDRAAEEAMAMRRPN